MAEESKALAAVAPSELVSPEEVKRQTERLAGFYQHLMQKGTDYDVVPGTTKPCLLKSGAELLRLWAGLIPSFQIDSTGTAWEQGLFRFVITCSLTRNGQLVAEGVGECNSLEAKYRYRWLFGSQVPAGVDKTKLLTREINTRQGKTRQYRLDNENPQDLGNTILKMAKKRAFVDAILTATGASRIFTQDVEETVERADEVTGEIKPAVPISPEPKPTPEPVHQAAVIPLPTTPSGDTKITPFQLAHIRKTYEDMGAKGIDILQVFLTGKRSLDSLTVAQANELIDELRKGQAPKKEG